MKLPMNRCVDESRKDIVPKIFPSQVVVFSIFCIKKLNFDEEIGEVPLCDRKDEKVKNMILTCNKLNEILHRIPEIEQ